MIARAAFSARRGMKMPDGNILRSPASTMLSPTERASASPCVLRFSGISAMPRRVAGFDRSADRLAEQPDLAGGHAVGAEDCARDLAAAGADQAAQADDLPGAHGQIDVGKPARAGADL